MRGIAPYRPKLSVLTLSLRDIFVNTKSSQWLQIQQIQVSFCRVIHLEFPIPRSTELSTYTYINIEENLHFIKSALGSRFAELHSKQNIIIYFRNVAE